MEKTNREIITNRMASRNDIRILNGGFIDNRLPLQNLKKKKNHNSFDFENQQKGFHFQHLHNDKFSMSLMKEDLRKPINNIKQNQEELQYSTRSKRNIDEMNSRLSYFTPLSGNSAYPLFHKDITNFDNKPKSTRCQSGNFNNGNK